MGLYMVLNKYHLVTNNKYRWNMLDCWYQDVSTHYDVRSVECVWSGVKDINRIFFEAGKENVVLLLIV